MKARHPLVRTLILFVLIVLVRARAHPDDPFTAPEARRHPPTERTVDVEHMKVSIRLYQGSKRIRGEVEITFRPLQEALSEVSLDCAELEVKKVTHPDGKPYRFRQEKHKLLIQCDPPLSDKGSETIRIHYEGAPRKGLYFVEPDDAYPDKPRQIWSQGEPEETRYWIPCHDYPNDRATSEMIVSVPRPYKVISNGKLVEVTDNGDGTQAFHWREEVPHVSYLTSLVVGEYSELEDKAGDVRISYYVPRKDEDLARNSFGRTPEMMKFFAEKIGVPYPYEKYSQVTVHDFMWGGMENISATTLSQRTLHRKRSRPLADSDGLVAHELAHQWWGDLLTCRSWAHIWLNEGFATYFTSLWFEKDRGLDDFRYRARGHQKATIEEDSSRYRRPVVQEVFTDPINLFDSHSYQKGASVLHMLRFVLGEEGFGKGIKEYARRHRAALVETEDLRRAMEEATGKDLTLFFRQWLYQAGHPKFRVSWDWDQESSMVELRVSQVHVTDETTPLFDTPVAIELDCGKESKTFRLRVRDREQVYYLPAESRPLMVRFDKGGWLLKELEFDKGPKEVLYQLSSDDDVTGRLFAIELLEETNPFDGGYEALGKAVVMDPFWGVRSEAARALGKWGGKKGVDHLSRALQDDDARVRQAAVTALGKVKEDRALALIRSVFAGDANDYVEAAAALALGEFHDKGVEEELLRGLDRESHQDVIRSNIVRALGNLGGEKILSVLLAEAEYGKPPPSRRAAIGALKEFAGKEEAVRDRLVGFLQDRFIWARRSAADVLADVGDDGAVQGLQDLVARETDGRVRQRARRAIRMIQERASAQGEEERTSEMEKERDELKARIAELELELSKLSRKGEESESPPQEVPVGAGKE